MMGFEELLHDPVTITWIKTFTLTRRVETVRCVTSKSIVSLFGDRIRPTATYYVKTFDVKLPKRLLERSDVRLRSSLFRNVPLHGFVFRSNISGHL